jgi:5-methylcytosine-specific restriction enzyme A
MLKPCLVCSTLSHWSRCPSHRIKRPSATSRGYDSKWQRISKAQIKAVPWCQCQGCGLHSGPCNAESDLTADHVRPLARGGTADGPTMTLCRACNSSKKDRQ